MRISLKSKSYVPDFPIPFMQGGKVTFGTEVYDDLMMSATLIEYEGSYYYWLTLDIGIIRSIMVDLIYEGICNYTSKLEKDHLFISATHTHSGPIQTTDPARASHEPGFVETRETVCAEFLDHLGKVAGELFVDCEGTLCKFHSDIMVTQIEGCYSNRNGLDQPCDKSFTLIRFFDDVENTLVGIWMNMSCHSTIIHPRNEKMSSDLVGGIAKRLAKHYGVYPQPSCGCQGDTSTRLTRNNKTANAQEDLIELDHIITSVVDQVLTNEQFEPIVIDRFDVQKIELGYDYYIDPEETEKRLCDILTRKAKEPDRHTKFLYDGNIKILKHRLGANRYFGKIEGWAIHLGELKIAGISGELVNSLGLRLIKHEAHDHRIILGYINDEVGYLVEDTENNFESIARIIPIGMPTVFVGLLLERFEKYDWVHEQELQGGMNET